MWQMPYSLEKAVEDALGVILTPTLSKLSTTSSIVPTTAADTMSTTTDGNAPITHHGMFEGTKLTWWKEPR